MTLTPASETEETGKWKEKRKVYVDDSVSPSRVIDTVVIEGQGGGVDLSEYNVSNMDADVSPNYYGFERADGAWYILRETLIAGADEYMYIAGSSDLSTTWATRASETYDTFANTF